MRSHVRWREKQIWAPALKKLTVQWGGKSQTHLVTIYAVKEAQGTWHYDDMGWAGSDPRLGHEGRRIPEEWPVGWGVGNSQAEQTTFQVKRTKKKKKGQCDWPVSNNHGGSERSWGWKSRQRTAVACRPCKLRFDLYPRSSEKPSA